MAELKTRPTAQSVDAVIERIADPQRREDCRQLLDWMRAASGAEPVMWGARIIGFGRYRYRYESGHGGEWALIGFASGAKDLTLYLLPGFDDPETTALLARLGKHRIGKSCLYLKRLADVDAEVLQALIRRGVAGMANQRID